MSALNHFKRPAPPAAPAAILAKRLCLTHARPLLGGVPEAAKVLHGYLFFMTELELTTPDYSQIVHSDVSDMSRIVSAITQKACAALHLDSSILPDPLSLLYVSPLTSGHAYTARVFEAREVLIQAWTLDGAGGVRDFGAGGVRHFVRCTVTEFVAVVAAALVAENRE